MMLLEDLMISTQRFLERRKSRCFLDSIISMFRTFIIVILILISGCHAHVHVDKRPNLALPILDSETHSTNDWVIVD